MPSPQNPLRLALLLLGASAIAGPLTLDAAVNAVLAENPELAARAAEVDRARAELRGARLWLPADPVLEGERTTDAPFASRGEGGVRLAISQELGLGLRGPRTREAAARLRAAQLALDAGRRQLVSEVRGAFFELRAAEKMKDLAKEEVALNDELLQAAERRFGSGDISELERDLAGVDAGLAKTRLAQVETDQWQAAASLSRLMGAGMDATPVIDGEGDPDDDPVVPDALDADALVARAPSPAPKRSRRRRSRTRPAPRWTLRGAATSPPRISASASSGNGRGLQAMTFTAIRRSLRASARFRTATRC